MPREAIGSCGHAQLPYDRARVAFEQECGIALLRVLCGTEPAGTELAVTWQDHELGEYSEISLVWEQGSLDEEHRHFISQCETTIRDLDECVKWDELWDLRKSLRPSEGN